MLYPLSYGRSVAPRITQGNDGKDYRLDPPPTKSVSAPVSVLEAAQKCLH